MKAIFIDAKNQQVSIIETKAQLEDKYLILNVNMVEIGKYYPNGDTLWVDEEGLINGTDFGFQLDGVDYMGNGLILGTNRENPELDASAVTPVADLKLKFFTVQFAQ
jgi:hypothetical protein